MATINSVHLSGRLARDPLIKRGDTWVNARITLCTSDTFKTRQGEDKEVTIYHNLTLWNQEAEMAEKYLTKGKAVTVEGHIKEDKWLDKGTNQERSRLGVEVTKIVYMEKMAPLKEQEGQLPLTPPPSEADASEFDIF